jgi:hypothetical protein
MCVQARDLQELQNRFNAAEGANLMLARSQGESLRLAEAARAEAARARDALAPATAEIRYEGALSCELWMQGVATMHSAAWLNVADGCCLWGCLIRPTMHRPCVMKPCIAPVFGFCTGSDHGHSRCSMIY